MPQSGVFKQSEVFQTLQQETRKTKEDIEEEQKRWTTFLQKPNRPIPQPKFQLPVKKTYKPPIVKQPKPLVDPEIQEKLRSVSPAPSPFRISPVHLPLARATASPEPKYPEEIIEEKEETTEEVVEEVAAEPEPEPQPEPEPEVVIEEPQVTGAVNKPDTI